MSFEAAVHAQAIELDRLCLDMCAAAGSGHPTTGMSLGHIVTVLMFQSMRWSPDHPAYPTSDRLVLSEGHAVPIVYAACAKLGVMVGKDPENRKRLTLDDLDGQPFVWDVWEARRPDWFGYVDVDESDGTDPRLVPLSTTPPPRLAVTPVFRPRRMVPFFHRVMPIGSDTTLILLEKNT